MKHLRLSNFYLISLPLWLTAGLALLCPFYSQAQQRQFIFEQLQGVYMQPPVHTMDLDEHGRLWYGTWGRGVFSYDGYAFKRYQNDPVDSNSLVNDRIFDLEADQKQRIWVSSMNGLDRMNRKTGEVKHFQALGDSIFQFIAIFEDKSGQVWASGARGVLRYAEASQTFENVKPATVTAPAARPNVFLEDAAGVLWMGRADGLLRFSEDRRTYTYLPVFQDQSKENAFRVQTILEEKNGTFWLAGYDGILHYDRGTGQTQRPQLPDSLAYGRIAALLQDGSGNIWMAVPEKGLYRWNPQSADLQHFEYNEFDPTGLPSNNVYSLLYDPFGNLWAGTDRGLARLNLLPQPFSRWLIEASNPALVQNNVIRLAQDQLGGILLRTQKGMYYLEKFGRRPQALLPGINCPVIFEPDDFARDREGEIWAAYDGLYRWNPRQKKFIAVKTPLQKGRILSLAMDRENANVWWLGTLEGLHRFDLRSGEIRLFKDIGQKGQARGIGKIVDDGQGSLWLSAPAALTRFDKKTGTCTFFTSKTPPPKRLPNDEVLDLLLSSDQWLWVTTASGITRIELSTGAFKHLNHKDGLPDNLALSVLQDTFRNTWFVFPEHLMRMARHSGEMRIWNTASILQTGQLSKSGGITLQDGRLLLASRGGLTLVDPAQMDEVLPPSAILLTRFETSEKGKKRDVLPEFLKHIQLANQENNITLEWAGIQTNRSGELRYECKLERKGENLDWEQKGPARQAVYANLDPGAYTFHVRIAGSESPELVLEIAIAPAWYQAESFKMLLMALLVTAAYLFWRNREDHRELLQQKELAEQNARYKTRFLANMSHEIRTPMNAILGLSRLLTESALPPKPSEYADAIRQSSENLLVIVNDVLDQAKIESGKFKFQHKPFDLELIVRHLQNTLGFKAEEKGLHFEIRIDPETPTRLIGDPVRLNQILTNLLGNAIKFTEKGEVTLEVQPRKKDAAGAAPKDLHIVSICFQVGDTGIGIPPEQLSKVFESFQQADDDISANYGGTGLGLSITKDLVEQQGGKIDLESELGKGTLITASMPFELDVTAQTAARQTAPSKISLENLRVLLVEDTFFNQMLAIELLKSRIAGVDIEVAENGQVALEKIETDEAFDLVLMDVKMPVMDGLEATRRIRSQSRWEKLPIIALTANAVQEELDKCHAVGMDAYVTKPIDTDELFETIRKVLGTKE